MDERTIRILLVEDDAGDARLLQEMLRAPASCSYAMTHCGSMAKATAHLAAHPVEIILLDLGLPDAQGLEAVRQARTVAPRVPLVVLTGLDDELLAAQALHEGAQDYLVKNQIEPRRLQRAVRYAIERKMMEEVVFAEKERAQVTLNSIGDAVACTDVGGNITYMNPVAEGMVGFVLAEAVDHPLLDIFRIVDAGTRRIVPDASAIGCTRDADLAPRRLLLRPDGSELPIEGSVAPIHDRQGQRTGAVIVIRDVSAAQAMARRMAYAADHLAKQNTRLSQANDQLASLIRSSPIAIYATDAEGRVTMWSPAAERLSGFSAGESLGRAVPIVPQDRRAEDHDLVRRVGQGERLANIALTRRRKDGSMVEVSVSMGPLTDESGVPRGVISLAEIVTEEVSERRKVERMQSEFVATVSHELRTPLTSIAGSLGLVAGGAAGTVGERAARLIDIANNNTQRLIRLVNDILDIEKLQLGRMVFRFAPVAVGELVAQTIAANLPYAASFGISLRRDGPSLDVCIKADPDRLTQALTNLISNAVKFSPPGAVVDIRTALTAKGVRISVADQGPGIAEEFRPRIFERFAQADATDMRQKGGSGLGLSIAREIVLRHEGQLSFDTWVGKGTTFHLDFTRLDVQKPSPPAARVLAFAPETPNREAGRALCDVQVPLGSPTLAWIAPPSTPVGGSPATRGETVSANRPSVLHVEDDRVVVAMVRHALQEEVQLVVAPTLEMARHYVAHGRFHLVILDLTLPDGPGRELIPTLAAAAGGPIPIVVFTGQDATLELGELVKTVLTKSKDNLATLVEVVRSILSIEKQRDYTQVETYDATAQSSLHR